MSNGASMSKSKRDFWELLASGRYYARQRADDRNREDISIRREDGAAAEIYNYPYRINQIPGYIFDDLVRAGLLKEDGKDDLGAAIFRVAQRPQKTQRKAA
jgi:hypothetical protein